MSLGNQFETDYTNKPSNGFKAPEVNSGYSLFNSSRELPEELHSCITFSYWKSCIKISIAKRKVESYGKDVPSYDMENKLSIYVRHQKARMLASLIRDVEISKNFYSEDANPKGYDNVGIGSGNGVIVVTEVNGTPAISIRKAFDDGSIQEATYIINQRYDVLYNHDAQTFNFESNLEDFKYIELDIIAQQLEDFATAMNNAIAYSMIDSTAYANYKLNNNITAIASKLGVDLYNNNKTNNAKRGYNSFNNTNSVSSFSKSTIEELDEAIGGL